MGFIFRKFMKAIMSGVSGNVSKIVTILFAAFKGMPIRVGLAILGSIIIATSFLGGLLWGFFSANLYNEDFRYALQNSITPMLILIILWISLATFLPSLERNLGLLVEVAPEEKNSEEKTSNDEN